MKISVTLKDPDGFSDCVSEDVAGTLQNMGLDKEERESIEEVRVERAWKALARWVDCQEYVTIEFDTEAMTATVKERT